MITSDYCRKLTGCNSKKGNLGRAPQTFLVEETNWESGNNMTARDSRAECSSSESGTER